MKEYLIREANMRDLKAITKLTEEEFAYTDMHEIEVKERMTSNYIKYYVIRRKKNSEFAGFIDIEQLSETKWSLEGLAISEKYRGHQIGQQLVDFGIKVMRKQGAKVIRVLVKSHNDIARHIYVKKGFKVSGVKKKPIAGDIGIYLELK